MKLKHSKWTIAPLALSISLALTGCDDSDTEDSSTYTLQLLHVADIDGSTSDVLAYAGNFAKNVSALTSEYPDNTLFLSSGDNLIPGSIYDEAEDDSMMDLESIGVPGVGRAHIALMNEMGIQASAVGNHDLDGGPEEFVSFIAEQTAEDASDTDTTYSYDYIGANFPYLSANLDFSADDDTDDYVVEDGQAAGDIPNSLAASTIIEVNGETIGIVGATTPTEEDITDTGDIIVTPESNDTEDLAEIIQEKVDELTAQGINKIILLAHMQTISVEEELAELLTDVDIIVAGGSNTILADDSDDLLDGDTAAGDYPELFENPDGDAVAVVNVDGDYRYLGRLVVKFDEDGKLLSSSIDEEESGAYASDDDTTSKLGGSENTAVTEIISAIEDLILDSESNILGQTDVYLNGTKSYVRTEETNLGDMTADANLWYAKLYDDTVQISIKNGGGIRAAIGYSAYPAGSTDADDLTYYPTAAYEAADKEEGDISQYDIQTALAFNNGLALVDVTVSELKDVLENGVSEMDDAFGGFPQVAGICFEYDSSEYAGSDAGDGDGSGATSSDGERVNKIAIDTNQDGDCDDDGDYTVLQDGSVVSGYETTEFNVVTLSYLSSGGNNYPFPCDDGTTEYDVTSEDVDFDTCTNQTDLEGNMASVDPGNSNFDADDGNDDNGTEQDALAEYLQEYYNDEDGDAAFATADEVDGGGTDVRIINTNE